jgi:HK97 family phage prohead protease
MITKDRSYRSFDFKQEDDENKIVVGVPIVFDRSTVLYEFEGVQYREVIDKNALEGVDLSDVVLNIDHMGKPAARTKNGTLKLEIRQDGLYMFADLSKNETGRELYEDIRNGFFDKMSFAFSIAEKEYDKETRTMTIKKIKRLYDVSAVTYPAYQETSISARSFFEAEAEKERQVLEYIKLRKDRLKLKLKIMEG